MVHFRLIIRTDRSRRIIQSCQQVLLDDPYIRGVLLQTIHHVLDMGRIQFGDLALHHIGRLIIPGYTDIFPFGTVRIYKQIQDSPEGLPFVRELLKKAIVFYLVLKKAFPDR